MILRSIGIKVESSDRIIFITYASDRTDRAIEEPACLAGKAPQLLKPRFRVRGTRDGTVRRLTRPAHNPLTTSVVDRDVK